MPWLSKVCGSWSDRRRAIYALQCINCHNPDTQGEDRLVRRDDYGLSDEPCDVCGCVLRDVVDSAKVYVSR